jgi:hypothetical protein
MSLADIRSAHCDGQKVVLYYVGGAYKVFWYGQKPREKNRKPISRNNPPLPQPWKKQ